MVKEYNKTIMKHTVFFVILSIIGFVCMLLLIINMSRNFEFYSNAEHVMASYDSTIQDDYDENKATVRFIYIVDGTDYTYDLECSKKDAETYTVGCTKNLFYNKKNPEEAHSSTKSIISFVMMVILLGAIGIYGLYKTVKNILLIMQNEKLVNENNVIMADFYKIKKKKSYYNTNKGIENYVLCKYKKGNEEYVFTSGVMFSDLGTYLKEKKIRVFVDKSDYKKYLVDMDDIKDKAKKSED